MDGRSTAMRMSRASKTAATGTPDESKIDKTRTPSGPHATMTWVRWANNQRFYRVIELTRRFGNELPNLIGQNIKRKPPFAYHGIVEIAHVEFRTELLFGLCAQRTNPQLAQICKTEPAPAMRYSGRLPPTRFAVNEL